MKKFLMPFFLLGALSVGFTSCGSDDDDDAPAVVFANIGYTVNGEESAKEITLAKGTILGSEGTSGEDDIIALELKAADGSKIKKLQITVNNSYEINTPVMDMVGNYYDSHFVYETPSTEKKIKFVGVYGKYSVKITTDKGTVKAFNINVVNDKDNYAYNGAGSSSKRYLCNKQTVILDANNKEYSNKFNTLTYFVKSAGGVTKKNFGNASLYSITQNDYENWQAQKGEFEVAASKLKFINDLELNNDIEYLVYKYGEIYYLMHITKIDDNIIKFDIQY